MIFVNDFGSDSVYQKIWQNVKKKPGIQKHTSKFLRKTPHVVFTFLENTSITTDFTFIHDNNQFNYRNQSKSPLTFKICSITQFHNVSITLLELQFSTTSTTKPTQDN